MTYAPNAMTDEQGAVLLQAAGYEQEFHPEFWEDTGDAESGPRISGHTAHYVYTTPVDAEGDYHQIVVGAQYDYVDGIVENIHAFEDIPF